MISLELYVLILLGISALSMYLIAKVLIKQIRLLRAPFEQADQYDEHTRKILVRFRYVLFVISLTIIVLGLVPVAINVLTLLINTGRPPTVKPISFIYSFTVHFQALMLSYLVSRLYQLASNEKAMTDFTQQHLEDELQDERLK
jgi:H+/gluconate symporter-like permease